MNNNNLNFKYEMYYGENNKNPSEIDYENSAVKRATIYFKRVGSDEWVKFKGSAQDYVSFVGGKESVKLWDRKLSDQERMIVAAEMSKL